MRMAKTFDQKREEMNQIARINVVEVESAKNAMDAAKELFVAARENYNELKAMYAKKEALYASAIAVTIATGRTEAEARELFGLAPKAVKLEAVA